VTNRERLAWAAGIFEGEGSITRIRRGDGFDLQISINMTDFDVLARFDEIVARGWLYGHIIQPRTGRDGSAIGAGRHTATLPTTYSTFLGRGCSRVVGNRHARME
jgi:hypothetical protein